MMLGIGLFLLGLLVGGLAPTMPVLVFGRLLQGVGAGVVSAVSYVCVGRGFPAVLHPAVFAVMSTAWVVPSLVSPLMASVIADQVGWRWVFLGLIPLTLVVALVGGRAVATIDAPAKTELNKAETPIGRVVVLAIGSALLLGGLGMEMIWIGLIIALAGVLIALPAFTRLTPPGTLVARPRLPAAVLIRGVLTFSFFAADTFISLSLTSVRGESTIYAGVVLIFSTATWTAGSWLQAHYGRRMGGGRMVGLGGLAQALGAVVLALSLWSVVPVWCWILGSAIMGLGMGMAYTMLSVVTLDEASLGSEGEASSALQMSDILGVALGTGLAGVMVSLGDRMSLEPWVALAAVFAMSALMGAAVLALSPRLSRPVAVPGVVN
jgi:MFS family permease